MIKFLAKFKNNDELIFINKDNYFNLMDGLLQVKFRD